MVKSREICQIGLLAAFIVVTGSLKLPSPFSGTEFQLSAPLAVAICAVYGPKKYLLAGLLASLAGLMLGSATIFNVAIAFIFRGIVALLYFLLGNIKLFQIVAGPMGTISARVFIASLVGKGAVALIMAAVPGMVFTALAAPFFTAVLEKLKSQETYIKMEKGGAEKFKVAH